MAPPARISIRPYRGPQDHPAMNRVANLVRAANGNPSNTPVEDMDAHYRQFDQAELPADCAIAELDGVVMAYCRASWEALSDGDGEVGAFMNIDPSFAGQGLEGRLTGHGLRRARELIRLHGHDRSSYLRMWIGARDIDQQRAAEAVGLRRVRAGAQLIRPDVADIPDIPFPAGYEVRPIGATDEAMHRRVWAADARAFAETWGQEAPTEEGYHSWRSTPSFDPPLWRVAFQGDVIAGQILNSLAPPEADGSRIGWTEAISVQPEHRRRGLARALLAVSLRAVRDAGATKAALGVDSQNPNEAQALYESMGYRVVSVTYTYELGPFAPGEGVPA
jgi:mycothiol synthase